MSNSVPLIAPVAHDLFGSGSVPHPAIELRLIFRDPGFGGFLDVPVVLRLADGALPPDPGRDREVELLDKPPNRRVLPEERAIDDGLIVPRSDRHAAWILASRATNDAADQRALRRGHAWREGLERSWQPDDITARPQRVDDPPGAPTIKQHGLPGPISSEGLPHQCFVLAAHRADRILKAEFLDLEIHDVAAAPPRIAID